LGSAKVVVIRGHGSVVVADNIKTLFFFCIYFEKNAQRLLDAYRAGNPEPLSKEEQAEGMDVLLKGRIVDKVWDYYSSKMV
jgi:ribulose-5-phosphate 4-epimerase/fuculose-1-phosphate aldolase